LKVYGQAEEAYYQELLKNNSSSVYTEAGARGLERFAEGQKTSAKLDYERSDSTSATRQQAVEDALT
jgi:hypothetical protein